VEVRGEVKRKAGITLLVGTFVAMILAIIAIAAKIMSEGTLIALVLYSLLVFAVFFFSLFIMICALSWIGGEGE
jgi:fatty acid desaturase